MYAGNRYVRRRQLRSLSTSPSSWVMVFSVRPSDKPQMARHRMPHHRAYECFQRRMACSKCDITLTFKEAKVGQKLHRLVADLHRTTRTLAALHMPTASVHQTSASSVATLLRHDQHFTDGHAPLPLSHARMPTAVAPQSCHGKAWRTTWQAVPLRPCRASLR